MKDITNKNIELTFDFVRELIRDPKKIKRIPDQAEIEFIEKNFKEIQVNESDRKILVKVKNTFEVIDPFK